MKIKCTKTKSTDFHRCSRLYRRMYVCRIIRRRLRNAMRFQTTAEVFLVVFFGSSLNNCIRKSFAVFNEENAENAEKEHDGAVNEE